MERNIFSFVHTSFTTETSEKFKCLHVTWSPVNKATTNSSANYFLNESINGLVSKSENSENCCSSTCNNNQRPSTLMGNCGTELLKLQTDWQTDITCLIQVSLIQVTRVNDLIHLVWNNVSRDQFTFGLVCLWGKIRTSLQPIGMKHSVCWLVYTDLRGWDEWTNPKAHTANQLTAPEEMERAGRQHKWCLVNETKDKKPRERERDTGVG